MRALLLLIPFLVAASPDPQAVFDQLALTPEFPTDLKIERRADGVRLHGDFSGDAITREARVEALVGALAAAGFDDGLRVEVPDGRGGWRPLGSEIEPPKPHPEIEPRRLDRARGEGALAGRRIAISAGHGWIPRNGGGWRTQRTRWAFDGCGSCRGITEDFFTAEFVTRYLLPLLHGMGAEVVLVREPGHDAEPAVRVDDGDAGFSEVGPWVAGNSPGGTDGDYRVLPAEDGGEATWAVPAEGARRLAVRYRHGGNRTATAELEVVHAGGRSVHTLDQRNTGWIWRDLGAYVFDADSRVHLRHGQADGYLIADAVKVGAGTHPEAGHPWWQMGAQPYVRWAGAPAEVTEASDVTTRPLYAEYADADLYLSIHANASGREGGSSAHGTSTYRYSCQRYGDHSRAANAVNCDDPPGSARLAELVHRAAVDAVHQDWDPAWRDGATRVANFGELRRLDTIPGVLVETGFFDNVARPDGLRYADNRALHDPRWRQAFARGLATGLARYFDPEASAPPARPEGLWARNHADGTLEVSWTPVPGARGYRLYTATEGRAWDDGVRLDAPRWRSAGLSPRQVYAFRVAAIDANGEGLPSQAVAARFRGARLAPGTAPAEALLISAYDRRDAWVQAPDNDLQTAVEHGYALPLVFDGALDERVESGDVPLAAYRLIDLAVGKESSADDSISAWMRAALDAHLDAGGRLLVSGEEIGWDLVARSTDPTEVEWLRTRLGAEFVADDAVAFDITGVGPFAAVGEVRFDDGTQGGYEVRYPDVIAPTAGFELGFVWPDGRGAAVVSDAVVYFGAGLEAIVGADARARVFAAAVDHLLPARVTDDLDGDGAHDACDPDPRDAADGPLDPDGDGQSTAAECAAGTDPLQADEPDEPDAAPPLEDAGVPLDAEVIDDAALDEDAAIEADALVVDAAVTEADAARPDAEIVDAEIVDAAESPDAGIPDAAQPVVDAGSPPPVDAAVIADAAPPRFDAFGTTAPLQAEDGGCSASPFSAPWWLALLLAWPGRTRSGARRRRR